MVAIVGYYFFVPSISGRTNRAYYPTLHEAIDRAKINGAETIYYSDDDGEDLRVMEVAR